MVASAASQVGRPLRIIHRRRGWTQITSTSARKLGAMMPAIAFMPRAAIVAAASPRRISRPRGRNVVGTGCTCSLAHALLTDVFGESGRDDAPDRGGREGVAHGSTSAM